MKRYFPVFFVSVILLISCGDDDNESSPEMVISGFSPTEGRVGEEVIINGANFGTSVNGISVKFGDTEAVVLDVSSEAITTQVPLDAKTGKISISLNNKSVSSKDRFIVLADPPVIESFEPSSGVTGNEIVIKGSGFSSDKSLMTVKFNGTDAIISESSETDIKVIVPDLATSGKISVSNQGAEVLSKTEFTVLPSIASFEPKFGAVGTIVTVTGTGFSDDIENIDIIIEGLEISALSASTDEITFMIPEGATSGVIDVMIGEALASTDESFEVVVEAISIGGSGYDVGYSIVGDDNGNYYVAGSFQNSITIEDQTIQSAGGSDAFLAKFNSNSELLWIKRAGGSGNGTDRIESMVIGSSGDLFVAMDASSNADFDGVALSNISSGIAIIKLSSEGVITWHNVGSASSGRDIALDSDGNIIVVGSFGNLLSFGTTTIFSNDGKEESYLAKLNGSTGEEVWVISHGGSNNTYLNSVAVDANDNIYTSGSFFESVTIESTTFNSAGGLDGYVSKFDSDGDLVWTSHVASSDWTNPLAIDVDVNGNSVVTGYFTSDVQIDGKTILSAGNEDIYVIKYDNDGMTSWIESSGSINLDQGKDVTITDDGSIYITGFFEGNISFGNFNLNGTGISRDIFLAKISSNGEFIMAQEAGSEESDSGNSIFVNNDGIIHITGHYRNFTTKFGITDLANSGNDDGFVWKIWPD